MPVATIDKKAVSSIDDELTDLSWLVQMNGNKQRQPPTNDSHHENKTRKPERINKPLAVVNGQTMRATLPTCTSQQQLQQQQRYSNEENQFYSHQSYKRKFDSSHHPTKRFHSEQTLPIYPTAPLSSESYYFGHPPATSMPLVSRYMLLKNDPSLSDTIPPVHMPTNLNEPIEMIEHESIYSDDIEHLLDIFKNEVEMIGLDPIASTSAGDCTLDMNQCVSSNQFCSY